MFDADTVPYSAVLSSPTAQAGKKIIALCLLPFSSSSVGRSESPKCFRRIRCLQVSIPWPWRRPRGQEAYRCGWRWRWRCEVAGGSAWPWRWAWCWSSRWASGMGSMRQSRWRWRRLQRIKRWGRQAMGGSGLATMFPTHPVAYSPAEQQASLLLSFHGMACHVG